MNMCNRKLLFVLVATAALAASGCMERFSAFNVTAPNCPAVSVVATGRMVESYKIYVEIGKQTPILLVPNIDMPQDVSQYVKYVRSSASGVDIGVVDLDYVKQINIQISDACRVQTVNVGA